MITVSVTITGEALLARLEAAERLADEALRAELEPFAGDVADLLAAYPSPPAGSRYQRTGDLGKGWRAAGRSAQAQGSDGNLTITLQNQAVDYDPFVQGADSQAAVHEGRWPTDAEIAADAQQQADQVGRAAARRLADSITG